MIEITISLAVIAFALVAIIGVLPYAMDVQRDNRQETIINQDATVFMNAIHNGEQGLDYLTNYVIAITNTMVKSDGTIYTYGYSLAGSTLDNVPTTPQLPLNTGLAIIGLLSTPRIVSPTNGISYTNHVVALVRSLSGPASEKYPQTNSAVLDLSLGYRLVVEVDACTVAPQTNAAAAVTDANLQANLHDLRLTFRWPLLPGGAAGLGRQTFRTMVSGNLMPIQTDPSPPAQGPWPMCLYFFQPRTFVQAQ
jgi:type II secretory pathway pseudopilin PulG